MKQPKRWEYRIHPAVGIARMGTSNDVFFLGRERPDVAFVPEGRVIPGKNAAKVPVKGSLREKPPSTLLLKQGARFRIFCYEYPEYYVNPDELPSAVWEVTSADYDITWTVEVANLKAWDGTGDIGTPNLPNKPPKRTFTTSPPTPGVLAFDNPPRLPLGSAFIEATGQLIVLGSNGSAQAVPPAAEKPDARLRWPHWEDDAADGPVTAFVTPKAAGTSSRADAGQPGKNAVEAWVVINMPNYGLDTPPSPSLYELALSHAIENSGRGGGWFSPPFVNPVPLDAREVMPVVRAYTYVPFVSGAARKGIAGAPGHGMPLASPKLPLPPTLEHLLVAKLRAPWKLKGHRAENIWHNYALGGTPPSPPKYEQSDPGMPRLNYLALPPLTHQAMQYWAANRAAMVPGTWPTTPKDLEWPRMLDVSHMGWMSGGSFFPGIEVGRVVHASTRWKATWGTSADHTDIRWTGTTPGEMTRDLASPWHADFLACDDPWWPMSRPTSVTASYPMFHDWMSTGPGTTLGFPLDVHGNVDKKAAGSLMARWSDLGFIRRDTTTGEYRETERILGNEPPVAHP